MRRYALRIAPLFLMLGALCAPADIESASEKQPYRFVPGAAACFCPSDHSNVLITSREELTEMLDAAPCTSRGEGAEGRAREWSERCWGEVGASEIDFESEALFYLARFFSSGMITGSLDISGPDEGVLTFEVRTRRPDGPLTPDLGFLGAALAVDKSKVRQIRTDDGRGNELILDVQ